MCQSLCEVWGRERHLVVNTQFQFRAVSCHGRLEGSPPQPAVPGSLSECLCLFSPNSTEVHHRREHHRKCTSWTHLHDQHPDQETIPAASSSPPARPVSTHCPPPGNQTGVCLCSALCTPVVGTCCAWLLSSPCLRSARGCSLFTHCSSRPDQPLLLQTATRHVHLGLLRPVLLLP